MHSIDFTIIVVYLAFITGVGLWASRKSGKSTSEYFLGGRSIPWFLLGISGMANFVDMGGTARQGAGYLLFGAKGFWLCMDGAVALLLSFQMIYVAKWLRRSNVMTNAEWMVFRFGDTRQGHTARVFSAISAIVICVALMTFFFTGTSQVLSIFVPEIIEGVENAVTGVLGMEVDGGKVVAMLFMGLVALYTVAAGFYGVIYTDFVQAILIFFLILFVAWKAFMIGTPAYFAEHAPEGWLSLWPTDGQWIKELPGTFKNIDSYLSTMSSFGILILFFIMNNLLQGFSTPFDAWTAQRYYAARDEREASLTVCQWIILYSFRFLLMTGVGIIALGLIGNITDPEHAMSVVIQETMPVGIAGLLLAALFAAQMSTVDSTVNSSAAYFVRDIYVSFFRQDASEHEQVRVSYVTTLVLIASGVVIGWTVPNVDSIWGWIMMGMFVGTLPPNIAKWYWWRSNGAGFALGILTGIAGALAVKLVPACAAWPRYTQFLFVFGVSSAGTLAGILAAKAPDRDTLMNFYTITRPFGFWGPVRSMVEPAVEQRVREESRRNLMALPVACIWHLSLFIMMSSILFKDWTLVGSTLVLFLVTSAALYKLWYVHLTPGDDV